AQWTFARDFDREQRDSAGQNSAPGGQQIPGGKARVGCRLRFDRRHIFQMLEARQGFYYFLSLAIRSGGRGQKLDSRSRARTEKKSSLPLRWPDGATKGGSGAVVPA